MVLLPLAFPWIVTGIGLLVASVAWDSQFPEPARFVTCLVLALLGSTFKVRLPGMQGNISISFVMALIAIAQMTLTESLVVGVLATLVQCFWRTRKRPTLTQVLFNISTLVVSMVLAFGVLDALRNSGALIPGLVVAAVLSICASTPLWVRRGYRSATGAQQLIRRTYFLPPSSSSLDEPKFEPQQVNFRLTLTERGAAWSGDSYHQRACLDDSHTRYIRGRCRTQSSAK